MQFELGDPSAPRGHALLYFRDPSDPVRVWATYLVVPPILMDMSKFIPPVLAAQLPSGALPGFPNVYPLPPFPEAVESQEYLRRLAQQRGDDLLDGGALPTSDLHRLMLAVSEASERYATLYAEAKARLEAAPEPEPARELAGDLDVDEILLEVMTPTEKVERLARALGTLRYAVEGGDVALARETAAEIERVGRRLDAEYRVDELLRIAREPGQRATQLSALYVERCYKLAAGDQPGVADLDRRIAEASGA